MQHAAQIQATIDLLQESIDSGYPADRLMANYFRARRYIGSKDKAAISTYFYQVLRSRLSVEYLLSQTGLAISPTLMLAVMLHFEAQDLNQVFTGQQHQPRRLTLEETERLHSVSTNLLSDAPENVRMNVPEWLHSSLQSALGDRYVDEMDAVNQRAQTDIRVNTLKGTRDDLQAALEKIGFEASATSYSAWGLRFATRVPLFNTTLFKQGFFEIQDEGSQLLAQVTGVKSGQKVVDFCAGAGGKTLAMAAMMNNKGVIYACDVHSKRLEETKKRAKRAGAHNIRVQALSTEHDKWVKQHSGTIDVVLIDAPCSGTGTWRRSPDSRWNLSAKRLADLLMLQASILQSAARLVKPGGRLLYATCSLLNEENQDQVDQFLQANAEFLPAELDLPASLSEAANDPKNQLRLLTHKHQTDGFFVAQMVKKS